MRVGRPAATVEDSLQDVIGDDSCPGRWRMLGERQTKPSQVTQCHTHSSTGDRESALIFDQLRILLRADVAPDQVTYHLGQFLTSFTGNEFTENRRVGAYIGPGRTWSMFPPERGEKGKEVAAPDGIGQVRSRTRLPSQRGFQLIFFVRGIAISIVAGFRAFHSRTHVGN